MKSRIAILTLLCSIGLAQMYAQAPGGVAGAELWLRAEPIAESPDTLYHWHDLSGESSQMRLSGGQEFTQRRHEMQSFNFHPAFHLADTHISATLPHTSLWQATILGVFASDGTAFGTDSLLYSYDYPVLQGMDVNLYRNSVSTGWMPHSFGTTDNNTSLRVVSHQHAFMPVHSVWSGGGSGPATFSFTGNQSTFYCPEAIVYGRMLSQLERRQVETYLALRHGITLTGSYFAPDGSLLWDYVANLDYHHRVTGIARWPQSLLDQPISTTSYEEGSGYASNLPGNDSFWQLRDSLPSDNRLLVIGRKSSCPLPEGGHLMWGDDNGALTMIQLQSDTLWRVMDRTWRYETSITAEPDTTSNCVELSYKIANTLSPSNTNHLVMLAGEDSPPDPEESVVIPCIGADSQRQKLLFDNACLTQASGQYFTFARYDGLLAKVTPNRATCDYSDDGQIQIDILCGTPLFGYSIVFGGPYYEEGMEYGTQQLTANEPNYFFGTRQHIISDLRAGVYLLTLCQGRDTTGTAPNGEYAPAYTQQWFVAVGTQCEPESQNQAFLSNPPLINQYSPRHAPSMVSGIDDITVDTTDNAALRVTRNAHRSFTATLTTADSGQAQLLVFDAAGRLLGQYPMSSSNVRTADFTVPVPGVYIVKALTDHNECSTRIISD